MENLGKVLFLQCGTKRDRQNQLRIMPWTFGWMLSFLAMTFAIRFEWITTSAAVVALSIVIMGLGVGTMLAYRRFLREADELVRKIELEALAATVGLGMVVGLSYWLLEFAEIVSEPGLPMIITLMMVAYSIAVILGHRRYS